MLLLLTFLSNAVTVLCRAADVSGGHWICVTFCLSHFSYVVVGTPSRVPIYTVIIESFLSTPKNLLFPSVKLQATCNAEVYLLPYTHA